MARSFQRRGRLGRVLARALIVLLLVGMAWLAGFIWFTSNLPEAAPDPRATGELEPTDAIVVLTGGSNRLTTGLELLAAGLGRKLFVSGVYDGVDVRELLTRSRQAPSELECCIVLGYAADNTVGNAFETADWMREQGYASLRLVTANYHMPRSLLEFAIAMPEVLVRPHPVASPNVHVADWWLWRGSANLLINEYNKYLVALLRYWLEKSFES